MKPKTDLFKFYALNEKGIQKKLDATWMFDNLTNQLSDLLPEGRELAIVKTKLEEACMFTIKGISRCAENQANEGELNGSNKIKRGI